MPAETLFPRRSYLAIAVFFAVATSGLFSACSGQGEDLVAADDPSSEPAPADGSEDQEHSDDDRLDEESDEESDEDSGHEDEDLSGGWGNHDLSCVSDNDCLSHETCVSSVCQVDRCSGGSYQSAAPLGDNYIFYGDLEFGIVDGDSWNDQYWVDGYSPGAFAAPYTSSWSAGSSEVSDVSGGNFLGTGEEGYVVSLSNAPAVAVLAGGTVTNFMVPFAAESIAAGDFNADGSDDIVIIDESRLAICDLAANDCQEWPLGDGAEPIDVAMADVDGDTRDEVLLLVEQDGYVLRVLNPASGFIDEPDEYEVAVDGSSHKVAAADFDADGRAEVVVLAEGGWFGMNDDELTLYRAVASGEEEAEFELQQFHHQGSGYRRLIDVTAGDINADDSAEIVALDDHDKALVYRWNGTGLDLLYQEDIQITQSGQRIGMADQDQDSPRAVLEAGPSLHPGASVPIVAMLLPPYSYEYSAGFSSTGYGLGETFSENYSDTISLSLNADVGIKGSFFGLFAASYSEKVGWKTSETLGTSRTMATGGRSGIRSQPEDFGFNYGAVVVSWGCFHAYTYEISDPAGLVSGSDGEELVLTVPVDGGTAMFSTGRYNAIAQAVGDLPIIEAPYRVGDPLDYPREPETIYGEPIAEEAYVFPDLAWYEVSDVGYVGWFNTLGSSTTNTSAQGIDMGASANITVAGVTVGAGFTAGWGKSYSLTLGDSAMFNGGIPPFRDDPATPQDEYVENFFRVAPITYMQDYTDSEGNEAAFYVSTYIVDID